MWKSLVTIWATLAFSFLAFANTPLIDARSQLLSGQYDTAISMGETMGTAEGFSLAAETLSAKVMLGYTENAKDSAKRARKLAKKALELDSSSQEAHVQYALAYGFETQSSSPFRAWRKNLPKKTLNAITDVREKFPEDPRGDALLGAWHLGIVRKAGEKRAENMFDANEISGIDHYEAALARTPEDIIILSNFAAVLLSIDADRHHDKTILLLNRIFEAPANNAIEEDVKSRMMRFQPHLSDPMTLMKLAEMLLDGERINDLPPDTQ